MAEPTDAQLARAARAMYDALTATTDWTKLPDHPRGAELDHLRRLRQNAIALANEPLPDSSVQPDVALAEITTDYPSDPEQIALPFRFMNGPWENSILPTITRLSPTGGDPHILATISRVHNPDALYELCNLANYSIPTPQVSNGA